MCYLLRFNVCSIVLSFRLYFRDEEFVCVILLPFKWQCEKFPGYLKDTHDFIAFSLLFLYLVMFLCNSSNAVM